MFGFTSVALTSIVLIGSFWTISGEVSLAFLPNRGHHHEYLFQQDANLEMLFQNDEDTPLNRNTLTPNARTFLLNTIKIQGKTDNTLKDWSKADRKKQHLNQDIVSPIKKVNESIPGTETSSNETSSTSHPPHYQFPHYASSIKMSSMANIRCEYIRKTCIKFIHDTDIRRLLKDWIGRSRPLLKHTISPRLCHCIISRGSHKGLDLYQLCKVRGPQKSQYDRLKQLPKLHQIETGKLQGRKLCEELSRKLCVACSRIQFHRHRHKRDIFIKELPRGLEQLLSTGDLLEETKYNTKKTANEASPLGSQSPLPASTGTLTVTKTKVYDKFSTVEKLLLLVRRLKEDCLRRSEKYTENEIDAIQSRKDKSGAVVNQNIEWLSEVGIAVNLDTRALLKHVINKTGNFEKNSMCDYSKKVPDISLSENDLNPPGIKLSTYEERKEKSHTSPEHSSSAITSTDSGFGNSPYDTKSSKFQSNKYNEAIVDSKGQLFTKFSNALDSSGDNSATPSYATQIKRTQLSATRHRQHSSSETCQTRLDTRLVVLRGCIPKSLTITYCQGTCHSRSVPQWNPLEREVNHVAHCTCCAPNSFKFRNIVFLCPRRRNGNLVKRVAYPFQCACRPCSITPEVEAEQPYDY